MAGIPNVLKEAPNANEESQEAGQEESAGEKESSEEESASEKSSEEENRPQTESGIYETDAAG